MNEDERVARFEAAYNRIDRALDEMLGERNGAHRTFAAKIRVATNRHRRLRRYANFLLEIAELRNALVHNRTERNSYIAVPRVETVQELESIEGRIFSPEKVVPRFQRAVTTLSPDATVDDFLRLLREERFARYPVYGREGFVGLLTTNGFARWCAERVRKGRLDIDTRGTEVSELIEADTHRDRVAFVSRGTLVDEVEDLYTDNLDLDAVIVTERGKRHEKPIGLICARDVAALE